MKTIAQDFLHSNDMKSLKIDPTPIASILEIANTINVHADLIFTKAIELKQFKLPNFNPEQIQTLRKAKDDIVLITEFFTSNDFHFKLENDEILNLVKIINQNKNTDISKYASCVILVGFLSFVHHIFFRAPIQFEILDALLHIDRCYAEIGLSSFLFAFKIIARHKVETITPDFLSSVSFFYLFNFQYPAETVEVLYLLIFNIYKVKSIDALPFVHIACQLSQSINITFPSNLIDKFLDLFQPYFLNLSIDYVIAFSNLLNKATPFKFHSTFSQIPKSILDQLQKVPSLPLPVSNTSEPNHSITINAQMVLSSSYFTPGFEFFEKPFNSSLLQPRSEIKPISNKMTELLSPLFKSTSFLKQYSSDFLNDLSNLINSTEKYVFELEDIFLQCSIYASREPVLSLDFDQILKFPYVNDPQLTIFNCECNPLFFIRKKMIDFLLISGQSNLFRQYMQNSIKWPLLYAEILGYLIDYKKSLKDFLMNNQNLNLILDSFNFYSKASQSCKDADQEYIKEIRIGRSYVIHFLSEMIEEYNDLIMSKDKIIYPFLGQLFEKNLRDFTLNILKKYLSISQNPTAIMNAISTVINGSIAQELINENNNDYDHYNQCIDLLISLFNMLNSVFENKTKFDGIENVFKSVSSLQLQKKGNSIDFFYCFLDSLYLFRKTVSLKPFIPFVSKCIQIFYQEEEMDEKLYDNLVRFIQDETIKSPEFLHLILNTFQHSSFFDTFMNLLEILLKKNENRIICHNSRFDEYLIDLINEDEDIHFQKSILNVFKNIALTKSSSSVVFKFISKLRPNDNSYLPNNEELLLEILREIVLDYYFEMKDISYSCGKRYKSDIIQSIELTELITDFTFYFWIFFHKKDGIELNNKDDEIEFNLIEIQNCFSIVTKNNNVFIKCKINDKDILYQINDLDMNWKWNLVSISFNSKGSKLLVQINNSISEQIFDFCDKLEIDATKITIGDDNLLNNDIEICNVSLIKRIKNTEITNIYKDGASKQTHSINFKRIESKLNEKNGSGKDNEPEINLVLNFVYYLLHSWEIDIIMPLFALSDINFSDSNRHFLNSFYFSMEIFIPAFLSIKNANSDIFLALSCILSTYSANSLTFSMYNRFYEFYEFITDDEIKDALFINILSNAEIWSHNESDVDKIVKHWSKFLLDSFAKKFSFSFALHYFYSYFNLTDDKSNDRMKSIRIILIAIAKEHFTKEDFQNLIIECIGPINESSFITLQNLVYDIPDKLKSLNLILSDVIHLNRIIIYKNQFSISEMIESIIILHNSKMISNISLLEHLNLILQDLPASAIHEEFYLRMIGNLNFGVVELIPICAWYCFKEKDDEASKQFVSVFKSITNLNDNSILIWPTILALKSDDSIKLSIIYHIADVFFEKWKEILILFDLVCAAIQYDSKEIQFYYMDYLLQKMFSSKKLIEKIDLQEFIDYYCFLIFYQRQNFYFCNEMKELFLNTFKEKVDEYIQPNLNYILPQVLNSNIVQISKDESYHLNFSLHFRINSINNHLIDESRLKQLIEIIDVHNTKIENLAKSILYLLDHNNHYFVQKQIEKNNFITTEIFLTPLFLKTLNQFNFIEISSEYRKIFKELSKSISDSIKHTIFGFTNFSIGYHSYEDYQSIVLQRRKRNRVIWARLWSSLSITKGPWDSKMVTEYRGPSRWKRDNTLCFALCPMKMKRNFHFITHGKSPDKKSYPTIALALFTDSSTDLMQFSSNELKSTNMAHQNSPENQQQQQQQQQGSESNIEKEINQITSNPYSLSFDYTVGKKSNKLIQVVDCKLVNVTGELEAKFLLYKEKIDIQVVNQKEITINNNKINYILRKTRFHRVTAIEILTYERMSYFIDFQNEEIWNSVIDHLLKRIKCTNFLPKLSFSSYFNTFNFTNLWKQREISNFEYLMHINILSGRSFNDLSQYPFLPWILTDYHSPILDLNNEDIYRPLFRPVGAIDSSNLKKILDRYEDFLNGIDEGTKPHMFPSGPISPLSICLFLTRMEPFTTLHVQLQGGKFDVPDRLVTSIEQLFNGVAIGNAESWELSPEFFFQVEFLTNDNEFDLGKINDERIDDIELPKWSSTPFDFIYKHRKALESDFVSMHINEWIDLNFGYLQKSAEYYNLYNDKLYDDVWQNYSYNDEQNRKIIETTLMMVGQIPHKIFKDPHPQRQELNIDYQECQQNAKIKAIDSPIDDSIFCVFSFDKNDCYLISISSNYELTTMQIFIENDTNDDDNESSIKEINKEQIVDILNQGRKYQTQRNNKQNIKINSNENNIDFIDDNNKLNIIKIGNGKFAILDADSFLVYSSNTMKKSIFEIPFVKCISSSNDWTIFSTRESILNIYEKNKRIASTHQYRDVITCCTVSNTFQMIVTGTKDGGLIVGSLSGINVRVLEIGNTPKKVMITPGWGFIVAYTEPLSLNIQSKSATTNSESNSNSNSAAAATTTATTTSASSKKKDFANSPEIVVYSLNGSFIRRLKLDAPIDDWMCWKSNSGFDFIAFSQGRKISYAEVYFLDQTKVARVSRDLIGFSYLVNHSTFVFVEKDGAIEKLYFPINDLNVGYNNVNK